MDVSKKITILMPVFNAERYLSEAIESILNQTFVDFEFMIINDGSTDNSEEIIERYTDKRIRFIKNEKNLGLIATLNKGFNLIDSEYIARMDADDVSLPTRLEKQILFMDKNTDIVVSGTSIQLLYNTGRTKNYIVRQNPQEIKTQLLFFTALMHPTVIIRRQVIADNNFRYNLNHYGAEDYGIFQEISFYYKLSNIREVLLKYRINQLGITQIAEGDLKKRNSMLITIYEQAFRKLGVDASERDLEKFRMFISGQGFVDNADIENIANFLKLLKKVIKDKDYDMIMFSNIVSVFFRTNCLKAELSYFQTIKIFRCHFVGLFKYNFIEKLKFVIRKYLSTTF